MGEEFKRLMRDAYRAAKEREKHEAAARGVTVDQLRAQEAADRQIDEARELADNRARRISRFARYITREDAERIARDELDTDAWRAVLAWLGTSSTFLVLSGGTGTGKTVAALGALARRGGVMVSSLDVVRAWRNEHDEARMLRSRILDSGFLVLDDLGVESDRDNARTALQELVNARQGACRTIITTNLSRASFGSAYDARTLERIEHGGVFAALTVRTSMRARGGARE